MKLTTYRDHHEELVDPVDFGWPTILELVGATLLLFAFLAVVAVFAA